MSATCNECGEFLLCKKCGETEMSQAAGTHKFEPAVCKCQRKLATLAQKAILIITIIGVVGLIFALGLVFLLWKDGHLG